MLTVNKTLRVLKLYQRKRSSPGLCRLRGTRQLERAQP
jgi:hypothetical protein